MQAKCGLCEHLIGPASKFLLHTQVRVQHCVKMKLHDEQALQSAQMSSTYDVTHKKPATPKQKIFFECRLEDLLRLLTFQPGP